MVLLGLASIFFYHKKLVKVQNAEKEALKSEQKEKEESVGDQEMAER